MTDRASKRAVLIAGPTASGKSALALALAEALDGTIINADSMQVYRDLRIITARPTAQEEARVPHLLYGHVDAAENYSVGRWCVDATAALAAVARAGRLPVVVGGTGLYFKALTRGLAAVPPIPAQIRAAVRERLKREGIAALYAELSERDGASARRLMPGDRARVTRALEVVLATGRSLTDWHREGMKQSATPAATASGRALGFAISCRTGLGPRPKRRWAKFAARSRADARAFAARNQRRRPPGRRREPTTPAALPCRCRNARAGCAARRRRW